VDQYKYHLVVPAQLRPRRSRADPIRMRRRQTRVAWDRGFSPGGRAPRA